MNFTNRQLDIIKKTLVLIDAGGIQNFTTKNLAEAMGFTEPALYRHFKNKTEILNSVLIHYQSELKAGMEYIFNSKETGLEQIKAVIKFQFETFKTNPAIIMVIFSEASFQNNSILLNSITSIISRKQERLQNIIEKGQSDGSIRKDVNPLNIAHIIMGTMRFTALRWKLSSYTFNLLDESTSLQQSFTTLLKSENK